ncbi:hypothetical protein AMAG_02824 [Allomyces macrogynus ATCC 38327]|uniref:Uncharacterized protein n=1 Tax=Allomyces macrogynus (strain ATCC 38327) TaxID=578462 RepID=A0A0L0S3X2_ALLM3|nr:hypothetical protein AMAG_02824 [Allomyces macrogynus ATCC 38327]|eukprot:KNE57069.1 hypothetical protein AMAG_02824 [Allomyces macrogynus ATCC 38327]
MHRFNRSESDIKKAIPVGDANHHVPRKYCERNEDIKKRMALVETDRAVLLDHAQQIDMREQRVAERERDLELRLAALEQSVTDFERRRAQNPVPVAAAPPDACHEYQTELETAVASLTRDNRRLQSSIRDLTQAGRVLKSTIAELTAQAAAKDAKIDALARHLRQATTHVKVLRASHAVPNPAPKPAISDDPRALIRLQAQVAAQGTRVAAMEHDRYVLEGQVQDLQLRLERKEHEHVAQMEMSAAVFDGILALMQVGALPGTLAETPGMGNDPRWAQIVDHVATHDAHHLVGVLYTLWDRHVPVMGPLATVLVALIRGSAHSMHVTLLAALLLTQIAPDTQLSLPIDTTTPPCATVTYGAAMTLGIDTILVHAATHHAFLIHARAPPRFCGHLTSTHARAATSIFVHLLASSPGAALASLTPARDDLANAFAVHLASLTRDGVCFLCDQGMTAAVAPEFDAAPAENLAVVVRRLVEGDPVWGRTQGPMRVQCRAVLALCGVDVGGGEWDESLLVVVEEVRAVVRVMDGDERMTETGSG